MLFVARAVVGLDPCCSEDMPLVSLFPRVFQAFLSNEDLGDSLDSVEALIKKHEDFEKSLAAQEEKIKVRAHVFM